MSTCWCVAAILLEPHCIAACQHFLTLPGKPDTAFAPAPAAAPVTLPGAAESKFPLATANVVC